MPETELALFLIGIAVNGTVLYKLGRLDQKVEIICQHVRKVNPK